MRIIKELILSEKPTSLALGYFDGLHQGHCAVIREAVDYAKANHLIPTVFTLLQSPRSVLKNEKSNNIITLEEKMKIIQELGIEQVYLIDFCQIKDISAEEFVDRVIKEIFRAKHISCGFNYHFGAGAKGSGAMLENMCKDDDISVRARPRITLENEPISSTRIRQCIINGDIPKANQMLGRKYGFCLPVVHGRQLGRKLGTPTLNQAFPIDLVKPAFGVYASCVIVDGQEYCGVTDIGIKPTVGSDRVMIETWMPYYQGRELYGETIDIRFMRYIRPEIKFDSIDKLKERILLDGQQAEKIFADSKREC